jgi:hypothetical protein
LRQSVRVIGENYNLHYSLCTSAEEPPREVLKVMAALGSAGRRHYFCFDDDVSKFEVLKYIYKQVNIILFRMRIEEVPKL